MQTPPFDIPRDDLPVQSRRSGVHVLKQLLILLLSPRSGLLNWSEEGVSVVRLLGFRGRLGFEVGRGRGGGLAFLSTGRCWVEFCFDVGHVSRARMGQVCSYALVVRKSESSRSGVSNMGVRRELLLDN
jgi:hypothetical protein